MNDPYSILGVSKDATDDEIKRAYRELARKYHPDNYVDNPLADLASEKMKEINEAYDAIVEDRRNGTKKKSSSKHGYTPPEDFLNIREMITKGRYDQAQVALDEVPVSNRNAEWYFLNGMVQFKRGYYDNAYSSFANAVRLDPSNPEYAQAFRTIQRRAAGDYGHAGNPYRGAPNGGGVDACQCSQNLICLDCCCECMGGDFISCC